MIPTLMSYSIKIVLPNLLLDICDSQIHIYNPKSLVEKNLPYIACFKGNLE